MKGGDTLPLTTEQMNDALRQLHSHAELEMHKPTRDWQFLSARGSLHALGYFDQDAEQVLQALYEHGFTHCLDPEFKTGDGIRPSADSCHWMPDQFASRLPRSFWRLAVYR